VTSYILLERGIHGMQSKALTLNQEMPFSPVTLILFFFNLLAAGEQMAGRGNKV